MEEIEVYTVVARQKAITDELQRLKININKDGPSRKTAEYKLKKLHLLELLWLEFAKNHEQIKPYVKIDTPYIQLHTYEKVQQAYFELKSILEAIVPVESESVGKAVPATTSEAVIAEISQTPMNSKDEPTKINEHQNPEERQNELSRILRRHVTTAQSLKRCLESLNKPEEDWSSTFCSIKISMLQKYWSQLEETHRIIHEFWDNPTQFGYNLEEYCNFEDSVQNHLIILTSRLNCSSPNLLPQSNMNSPSENTHQQALKLPKITLPKFDGNYANWKQYCDLFTELVDKQNIANCQKLFYLKTTLTGEAENLIKHFSTSDNNYDAAWQVVKDRYDNPRLLVTAQVQRLLTQPSMQSETAKNIKTLHDTTQECMLSLKGLNINTSNWDPILMCILTKRLDRNTLTLWEQSLKEPKDLPSLKQFLSFLEQRFQSLEAMGPKRPNSDDMSKNHRVALTSTDKTIKCPVCEKGKHSTFVCQKFLQLTPQERFAKMRSLNYCINCLRSGHQTQKCRSKRCNKCSKPHNTLLHINKENHTQQSPAIDNRTSLSATTNSAKPSKYVLLGTAVVNILNRTNNPIKARALLDSGSQMSFITEKLASKLHLITNYEPIEVSGMGNRPLKLGKKVEICLQSKINGYNSRIQVFVLDTITTQQPSEFIDVNHWKIPKNIKLADKNFHLPQDVDLLIGAELYPELIAVGQIKVNDGGPTLQNTLLGWVVMGKVITNTISSLFCGIGVTNSSSKLDSLVERFWQLEESISSTPQIHQKILTKEERQCEDTFLKTTRRSESGRYIVTLPFANSPASLGFSREIAVRRFLNLEKRLEKNPEVHRQYIQFMRDYIALKHMEEIKPNHISHKIPHYFLPHHCVLRPESSSTKLRVVFDGSSKTSTNLSLNQILHSGPALQNDLVSILLRFRTHKYVFTADISKMFRQILVDDSSKRFQQIVWRESTTEPLKTYQLNTVTYGTKSAPYLAIRCLHELADSADQQHLLGANILRQDIYMDDILTGSNDFKTASQMQSELTKLLAQAGFHLRKWCSNIPLLLKGIPKEHCETETIFDDQEEGSIKTLGLTWLPGSDQFIIKTNWNEVTRITKRSILSDTAHIFDPLGIVSPVVVLAKIYLQEIWALKLDWDAALPMEINSKWNNFRANLLKLNNLNFPRHAITNDATSIEIHAFSDASQRAYGAVVYLKSTNIQGEVNIRLLCSKTRVAPVKQQTIPRLELCAAKLLVQLVKMVKESLKIKIQDTTYWTDSQIVLSWINTTSPLKTFVANRIASIHDESKKSQWKFITSDLNPADLLSRGVFPEQLLKSTLWFQGPGFLTQSKSKWPTQPIIRREHQMVIPHSHDITKLLMSELHKENMHAGPQALLSIARQQYWILGGKRLAHSTVNKCIKCFKAKPKSIEQMMGNLPPERVQSSRPFMNVGIDFFGPVYIHYRIRGKQSTKAYVSVFICFATKAVHLELVTDLTTQAFLGALKRFVARRGCPAKIFSDNATNFIGAKNELNELNSKVFTKEGQETITSYCTERTIDWKPIPPRSPHFGGLWEAAVKSAKYHMKRIVSSASLTQEELTTVLAQIEAILNSRPLTPMSNNPNDLEAITPGHFLIGAPLVSVVDPNAAEAPPLTNIARWNLVTSIHQEFWRRWKNEYLQEIQQRHKWKHPQTDIQPGTLVLIKEDNLPPLKWPMGRVIKTICGPDKLTRVIDIKTASGEVRRAIAKVCPLPVDIQPLQVTENLVQKEQVNNYKRRLRSRSNQTKHPLQGRFLPIKDNSYLKRSNPERSSVPAQRIKLSPIKTLLACLFLLCSAFGQTIKPNAVEIQHFQHSPGVYFEDIGEAKLITDEWNLLIFFNMSSYWYEFQGIQKSVNQLKTKCEEVPILNQNNICKVVIDHLELRVSEMKNLNEILKYRNGIAIRNRRSPFDIIGTVANKLFGVLDQEYATFIEDSIQRVQNNENHLLELSKNQTSILETTSNILNKSLSSIKAQFGEVKQQLTISYEAMGNLNQTLQKAEILNFVTIYVIQIIDSFQRRQIAILDAISDTHHGKINAILLSPRQLLTELDRIRKIIPSSLVLPNYDEYNLPKLYELLQVRARVTQSAISLLIKLPLIRAQTFQLFKLLPLPVQQNAAFIFMHPSTEFLAVTPFRDQHFSLTQSEYQECIHIDDKKYLCKQRHPIFNTHSVENECEMFMLNHQKQISSHCQLQSSSVDRVWIQLHNPNHWIFAFQHEETLTEICGVDILTAKLRGVGLLKLGVGCAIKQPTLTIYGHNFYSSISNEPFVPPLNLSLFSKNFHVEQLQDVPNKKEVIIYGKNSLALLKQKIRFQKSQQKFPETLSHHDIHQYSIGYISLLGITILTTMIVLINWKIKRAQSPQRIEFELSELNAGENV